MIALILGAAIAIASYPAQASLHAACAAFCAGAVIRHTSFLGAAGHLALACLPFAVLYLAAGKAGAAMSNMAVFFVSAGTGAMVLGALLARPDRASKRHLDTLSCWHCGYSLVGCLSRRCPECGGKLTQLERISAALGPTEVLGRKPVRGRFSGRASAIAVLIAVFLWALAGCMRGSWATSKRETDELMAKIALATKMISSHAAYHDAARAFEATIHPVDATRRAMHELDRAWAQSLVQVPLTPDDDTCAVRPFLLKGLSAMPSDLAEAEKCLIAARDNAADDPRLTMWIQKALEYLPAARHAVNEDYRLRANGIVRGVFLELISRCDEHDDR